MEKALTKNQTVVCEITDYTREGLGVARTDGRVLFVHNAVRGDIGHVRIVKAINKAVYGVMTELTSPSPHRIRPECPVFPKCGGCAFQHVAYAEELRWKARRVADALSRIGGIDLPPEEVIGAESVSGYRNKAVYPVGWKLGVPVTGFYRARTNDIVPTERCLLQDTYADACALALRHWLARSKFEHIRHLFVRKGFGGVLCCIVATRRPPESVDELIDALRASAPVKGVVWDLHSGRGNVILSGNQTVLWGDGAVTDRLLDHRFSISVMSFYQVNRPQAEKLYAKALEYAGDFENAVDLYCGAGAITLCLARNGGHVTGIDVVPEAIADAGRNAAQNGVKNAGFVCMDAGGRLPDVGKTDVAVVDPPRKGLSGQAIANVLVLDPERLVYISCDPATLARDMKTLSIRYKPERLTVVDMFPRTTHVECVVLMSKFS